MQKLLLSFLVIVLCNFGMKAQLTCNASFTYTVTGLTVKFVATTTTPVSSNVQHSWTFGDGATATAIDTPSHTYSTYGTYIVKHKVMAYNGTQNYCTDSSTQTIILQNPCNLVANFTFTKDSLNRHRVFFTNTSLGFAPADSIRWNFGDGSALDYVNQNPTHVYPNFGTYNVCIRVKRPTVGTLVPCVSEICKTVVIDTVIVPNCNASFTTTTTGLTVIATPLQVANVQHQWNFGDGGSSTVAIPTHSYTTAGAYVIKHTVLQYSTNSNTVICRDSIMQTVLVQNPPNPCNTTAYYTYVRDSTNRKKFNFTNASLNYASTDTLRWSFGDGTYSNDNNPSHTFANYGMFTVCIRIARPVTAGSVPCVREYCSVVTVDSLIVPVTCTANFTTAITGATVVCTSAMTGANITHSWDFGNGTTSTIANPTIIYVNGGVYIITHKIRVVGPTGTVAICENTVVKTISITIPTPCNLQAYFVYSRDSANRKKVYFSNATVGFLATDSIRWNFGDGTAFSYAANPDHIYANYGTYNVCIRVKRNSTIASAAPCLSEICKTVIVDSAGFINTTCPYTVNFTMLRDAVNFRKVYFTNISTNVAGAIATWYFGDGTTATGWNAVHEYATTAVVYQPCLRVTYSINCSKIECKVLQLPTSNVCTLQPYPNPASSVVNGTVHLTQPMTIYTRIYNQNNFIVRQEQQSGIVGTNTITINVATLPTGMYRMEVQYGNQICRAMFMKQ